MPGNGTPHLWRRGEVYYFRRAVPLSLRQRIGRAEIKVSLQTREPGRARLRCRALSNRFDALMVLLGGGELVSQERIDALLREFLAGLLGEAEETVWMVREDDQADAAAEAAVAEEQQVAIQAQLAVGKLDTGTRETASALLAKANQSAKELGTEEFEEVCRGVLRARAEQRRILAAMLRGAYNEAAPTDPLFTGVKSAGMPPPPGSTASGNTRTVGQIVEAYTAFKQIHDWTPKTANESRRVLCWFRDGVGAGTPVQAITKDDVREFRDLLLKLPKGAIKAADGQAASLKELAKAPPGIPRMAPGTLQKYFGVVRSFLQWCEDEGYIDVSPAMKVKTTVTASLVDARDPFSATQLEKIFASSLYRGCKSTARRSAPGKMVLRDATYWIPIVGLFSGMRLGEIVLIQVGDIRREGNVDFFDVSEDAEGKSLKTKSSRRRVPIHGELVKLGLLHFVEGRRTKEPQGRLFDVTVDATGNQPSKPFSKWFGRYLVQIGVKTPRTTFHSFRHSFAQALRVGKVEDSHIKALLGHSDTSTTAIGAGIPLQILAEDVEKVSYEIAWNPLYRG